MQQIVEEEGFWDVGHILKTQSDMNVVYQWFDLSLVQ